MTVEEVMKKTVVSISPEAGLDRALIMMRTKLIRHLPVIHEGKLVGIVTDRDLRLAMEDLEMQGPKDAPKGLYLPALKKVSSIMISEVLTVFESDPLSKALNLMCSNHIGGLPVLEKETRKVVGIITETDLLSLLLKFLNEDNS